MTELRPPSLVMRLERLGASHQTRLSFMRVLLRKLAAHGWQSDRPHWQIDESGVGHAVYRIRGGGQTYSLVAFAHDLPDDLRSDRVIAEAWDATFALVDGEAGPDDIARLKANVPLQEAGRVTDRELVLSRANKSMRVWDYVVGALAEGKQPDPEKLLDVGYLMRTTAVYGSGKFGAADFASIRDRPVVGGPFRIEMLAVWLIRAFVVDLAEHMAAIKGGANAVKLAPVLRRQLGIGNSTGLGMAPFLVNHPTLLNAWIMARETALARVRSIETASVAAQDAFHKAFIQAKTGLRSWRTEHPIQQEKITRLHEDITRLSDHLAKTVLHKLMPWDALYKWGEAHLSLEGQELLAALILEPYGALIDDLADQMSVVEEDDFRIDGSGTTSELLGLIRQHYAWALDFADTRDKTARFWYTSEAKLEPRLGERQQEPGAELELPLATARDVAELTRDLSQANDTTIAEFLATHARHRHTVRRVLRSENAPYSEIQDNLIAADMLPIDMLRCKLAFFGATHFDPRSDRWLRITMFQGAPFPHELHDIYREDWVYAERVA